ncbi:type II and III secretion system protein family protein [Altericroceibacterium xinjiangense]|uniref:type II and III secretion system protein family protein n=1 Tax=Altericroceibacterium xinjiangense TaxID=762261 RepID=UPI000F7E5B27|nr:type II and III secretion system protein family protein [Altericroceibacterium xinjiangense]
MIRPLAAAILLATAAAQSVHPAAAQEVVSTRGAQMRLPVGAGRLIRLSRPAASVFVADSDVADVHVRSPTLIYVMPKAPGSTALFAIDAAERVVLGTDIVVGFDEERLATTIRQYAPDSRVTVSSLGDALVLSGEVPSAAAGEEILRMASRLIGAGEDREARLINRLTLTVSNQVNLRVRVAEVSREAGQALGFNWNAIGNIGNLAAGFATGGPLPPETSGTIYGGFQSTDVQVDLLIDALERQGLVTVLAEPNLTARSGEPASFLAGGEYPIPVPQGLNQITIEYKRYGVSLSFVATVLDADRISLDVRPEVSQLSSDGAITLNGITVPALTTRWAETTVELGSGQSFAIAGLLQNTTGREVERLPGLGDLPVLGQLFRSTRFQQKKTELVIIVTPYLVRPVSQPLPTPVDLLENDRTIGTTETNLASMVAYPEDLHDPLDLAPTQGSAGTDPARRFRRGEVKRLPDASTTLEPGSQ